MDTSLSGIKVVGADGKTTAYNGVASGVASLGNANVYNVPVGDGTFYSGVASGYTPKPTAPAAPTPGVQQTTTELRNTATTNGAKLNSTLATLGSTNAQNALNNGNPGTVTVTRDIDNGDGTRTVTYSDGKTANVVATKNADGSESYKEIGDGKGGTAIDPNSPEGQIASAKTEGAAQVKYANDTLDTIHATADAATQALIASIKQIYGARITQMQDSNSRILGGKTQEGIRSGRARYATDVQNGILTDEEQSGIMRVATLQGEMLQEIAKAQQAQNAEDLTVFNSRMEKVAKIKSDLADQVSKIHQSAIDAQKAQMEAKKNALDMDKTTNDLVQSKAKASAPAIIETLKTFKTATERSDFLEAYAKKTGIPMDILMGTVSTAADDKTKADLALENVRSEINARAVSTQKTKQDISQASGDEDVKNILNGISSINDVDKTKKALVKSKLQSLGLYEDTAPSWFIQAKNAEAGASLTPEALKPMWDEYRKKATAEE